MKVKQHMFLYLLYEMVGHNHAVDELQQNCTVNADESLTCEDCYETICFHHICPPGNEGEKDCSCEIINSDGAKCKDCNYCVFGDWSLGYDCTDVDGTKSICSSTFSTHPMNSMPPDAEDEKQVDTCINYEDGAFLCYWCYDDSCELRYKPPGAVYDSDWLCEAELYGLKCKDCYYCGFGDGTWGGDCSNIPTGQKWECGLSMPPDADDKKQLNECIEYPDSSMLCYYCYEGGECDLEYCPENPVDEMDCVCEVELYGIKCTDCYYCGIGNYSMGGDCSNVPNGLKWECN